MTYPLSRVFFTVYLKTCFRFEVCGKESIPDRSPFIIVANHISYGDPVAMAIAFSKFKVIFIAKKELFHVPLFNVWFKSLGCIPIERWSGSSKPLKRSLKKLKEGGVLGIFPEGSRSIDGKLQKAQDGVGLIAAKSGVPIIPIYISGTDKALPRGKRMPRPCKIRVKVGKAVDITESLKINDRREIYGSIGEKIMESISKLKDET